MTPEERKELEERGYIRLDNFLTAEQVALFNERLEAVYEAEGENAGSEFRKEANTRRLANLVDKGDLFRDLIVMPEILERVEAVLGPNYKLSSLNARSANPNSDSGQPLHADMGLIPDETGYAVCNTVWMLDDFTEENGALRAVPGSHKWGKLPALDATCAEEELITGKAGTVVVMNAHTWHGGTANRTANHRRALHGFYVRSDKPQQQYQKQLLRPETVAELTPIMRRVLALDDPLNDELSSKTTRVSGFLK
jgi:ectoine hydroxylase-related dioxygenase (phytanoyl-CoA dioxygenase family)